MTNQQTRRNSCHGSIESVTGWSRAHGDEPPSTGPATIPDAKHKKTGKQPECFDVSEGEAVFLHKNSPNFKFSNALPLEIKAESSGRISGYGSIFGNVDGYGERVLPGAFKASLAQHSQRGSRLKMLWQHRADMPIGIWSRAVEDGKGLFVDGQINLKTDAGRNAYEHISAGDVDSLSIGYHEKNAQRDRDGVLDLIELDVYEVSPVTFPANRDASITGHKSQDEIENILRAGGLSKQAARLVMSGGWKALSKHDDIDNQQVSRLLAQISEATQKLKEI